METVTAFMEALRHRMYLAFRSVPRPYVQDGPDPHPIFKGTRCLNHTNSSDHSSNYDCERIQKIRLSSDTQCSQ